MRLCSVSVTGKTWTSMLVRGRVSTGFVAFRHDFKCWFPSYNFAFESQFLYSPAHWRIVHDNAKSMVCNHFFRLLLSNKLLINNVKTQAMTGRTYLQYLYVLYSEYTQFLQTSRQKTSKSIEKLARDVNKQFTEMETESEKSSFGYKEIWIEKHRAPFTVVWHKQKLSLAISRVVKMWVKFILGL